MDPVIRKFRGAINGFNRRDVLQYIEQLSSAHRKELNEMQKELSRIEGERKVLESTLAGLEDEKGTVAAEEARVRASLEESTVTLSRLRGELSETETQLAAARSDLERYRREVSELAPMARNYEELKDRVATVELDAHRKAQATVDEAKAQAAQLREQTRQWLEGVLAQYSNVRGAVDELFRSAQALSSLEEQVHLADEQAGRLSEQSRAE